MEESRKYENPPNAVLILETSPRGHRLVYVRELILHAQKIGSQVVLATNAETLKDPRYETHLGGIKTDFRKIVIDKTVSCWSLQKLAIQEGCDLVVVPDALKYGGRLFLGPSRRRPQVRLLIMNDPRWSFERQKVPLLSLAKLIALKFSGLRMSVSTYWLRPQGTIPAKNIVIDPLILAQQRSQIREEASALRKRMRMEDSIFWFGIVGGLETRKNIPLVAEALKSVSENSEVRIGLALIGPWADDSAELNAKRELSTANFPVRLLNERLSNEEMNVAVASLDCVVMAYSTNSPNSSTAKAVALGIRVVTAGSDTFRRLSRSVTGHYGTELNVESLSRELTEAISRVKPPVRELLGPSGLTEPLLATISTRPARFR